MSPFSVPRGILFLFRGDPGGFLPLIRESRSEQEESFNPSKSQEVFLYEEYRRRGRGAPKQQQKDTRCRLASPTASRNGSLGSRGAEPEQFGPKTFPIDVLKTPRATPGKTGKVFQECFQGASPYGKHHRERWLLWSISCSSGKERKKVVFSSPQGKCFMGASCCLSSCLLLVSFPS